MPCSCLSSPSLGVPGGGEGGRGRSSWTDVPGHPLLSAHRQAPMRWRSFAWRSLVMTMETTSWPIADGDDGYQHRLVAVHGTIGASSPSQDRLSAVRTSYPLWGEVVPHDALARGDETLLGHCCGALCLLGHGDLPRTWEGLEVSVRKCGELLHRPGAFDDREDRGCRRCPRRSGCRKGTSGPMSHAPAGAWGPTCNSRSAWSAR